MRSERTWLHPGQSAEILLNGQSIGYFGRLHPSLEAELDLTTTWVAEIDQSAVLQTYVSNFTELSRFPSVRRDIALLISDKINVSEIQQLIEKSAVRFWIQLGCSMCTRVKVLKKASAHWHLRFNGNIQHVHLKMLKSNPVWITYFRCWKTLTRRH